MVTTCRRSRYVGHVAVIRKVKKCMPIRLKWAKVRGNLEFVVRCEYMNWQGWIYTVYVMAVVLNAEKIVQVL